MLCLYSNSVCFWTKICCHINIGIKGMKKLKVYVNNVCIPENWTPRLSKFWVRPHTKLLSNIFDGTWIIVYNFVIFHSLKIISNMFVVKHYRKLSYQSATDRNRQWSRFENFLNNYIQWLTAPVIIYSSIIQVFFSGFTLYSALWSWIFMITLATNTHMYSILTNYIWIKTFFQVNEDSFH